MAPTNTCQLTRVSEERVDSLARDIRTLCETPSWFTDPMMLSALFRKPKRTERRWFKEGKAYEARDSTRDMRAKAKIIRNSHTIDSYPSLTRAVLLVAKGERNPDFYHFDPNGFCKSPYFQRLIGETLQLAYDLRELSAGGLRPQTITRASLDYLKQHCCCNEQVADLEAKLLDS